LYLASLPKILANSNKNYRRFNFPALANIPENIFAEGVESGN